MERSTLKRSVVAAVLIAAGASAVAVCETWRNSNPPARQRTARIGVDDSAPYQEWVPGQGPRGLSVDVLNDAAARRGITLVWSYHPEGPSTSIRSGRVDLWPLITYRKDVVYPHVTEPWLKNEMAIITHTGSRWFESDAWQRARIAHLGFSATVAIMTSHLPDARRIPKPSRKEAFQALCAGEADVFMVEVRILESLLLKRPAGCRDVALRARVVSEIGYPLATMSTAEFAPIAEELRDEIRAMQEDGRFAAHMARWVFLSGAEARYLAEVEGAHRRARAGLLGATLLSALLILLLITNRQLRAARAAADRASEAKSRFIANISHEVRTPLTGVLGMTELLLEGRLEPEERQHARTVLDSARHLHALLNDLLDLSKAEAGKLTLAVAPFPPRRHLEDAASLFRQQAAEKDIDFRIVLDESLPALLAGDAMRVRQVVSNLLSNALKFTEKGFVALHSSWSAGLWTLRVTDSGIGIPAEKIALLFEKFSQVDASASRRAAGTGLGLAICKRLAHAMGGDIQVTSQAGAGSTFTVTLPLPEVEAPAKLQAESPPPVAHLEPLFTDQPKVLLAEDNPVNRRLLTLLLARLGCSVEAAENGRVAVEKARSGSFRAVFMDCQMPEMDGFEASRTIRASGSRVPIVAITAGAFESDRELCLRSGMNEVLAKPVERQALARVVKRWVLDQESAATASPPSPCGT
ncbi:MAG: ATP-binding protein [Bryobacteraceae bacterium]|nr:ATP-binding protein [Bryobacteraceae bacterium]